VSRSDHRGGDSSTPVTGWCATESDRKNVASKVETVALGCENRRREEAKGPTEGATSMRPVDRSPHLLDLERINLSVSAVDQPTKTELRTHVVALLDACRRDCETFRGQLDDAHRNRLRYIALAREYGMPHREIGELLGITESGVRKALQQAVA